MTEVDPVKITELGVVLTCAALVVLVAGGMYFTAWWEDRRTR